MGEAPTIYPICGEVYRWRLVDPEDDGFNLKDACLSKFYSAI